MEKNKSREQSTRSDVVRQLKAVAQGSSILPRKCLQSGQARRNPIFPDWRAEEIIQVWIFW